MILSRSQSVLRLVASSQSRANNATRQKQTKAVQTLRSKQRTNKRTGTSRVLEKEFGAVKSKKVETRPSPASKTTKDSRNGEPSLLSNPILWYSKKLETHPLTTKCLTSGIISGSGDLLCQYLVHRNATGPDEENPNNKSGEKKFEPDFYRTGRFGILGLCLVAPVVHFWYGSLITRFPGSTMSVAIKRTAFDQFFFAPLFLPTFMLNLMMLEGRPAAEVPSKLIQDVPDALLANWCLWIPAMMINFRFVPFKFQVLYSNMIGFVWNIYLSWKTQENQKPTCEIMVESSVY